jgi:hypothetical protein
MNVLSVGQLSKASTDATNLANKVGVANDALSAGDVATAVSLLSSITAANFPDIIGLSQLSGLAASVSIADAYARYNQAIADGDTYQAAEIHPHPVHRPHRSNVKHRLIH